MNAAVWFGAAVFYVLGTSPALTSPEMQGLLGARNYPYYSVAIAQAVAIRFYHLQLACSAVAVFHLAAGWLYLGKVPEKLWRGLLLGLIAISLCSGLWLQPWLKRLHNDRYRINARPEEQMVAATRFHTWQTVYNVLNGLMVCGLGAYFWRTANPPDATRFVSTTKFRS
jgi:hypothetical protein